MRYSSYAPFSFAETQRLLLFDGRWKAWSSSMSLGHESGKLFDGKVTTSYQSGSNLPFEWFIIDLRRVYKVSVPGLFLTRPKSIAMASSSISL